jgi:hypothetical protein
MRNTVNPSLRKVIVPALTLVVLAFLPNGSSLAEEITRVFLFAGQSNMVGSDAHADRIDDYPNFTGAGEPQSDVLYSYILGNGDEASQGWVPLKPLRSFGPEITFARRVNQHADFPIAIIKSAVGGTTVAVDWNPDAPDKGQKLYPRTLKLIRKSLAELDKRGVRYRLEAVMWHQGENDMLDRNLYKQYADGLTKLVTRLRADLKAPELKWYIAEVSEKGIWGMDHRSNLGIFHQQQQQALKVDPLLRWVPTSHLAFEVMGSGQPHYHYGLRVSFRWAKRLQPHIYATSGSRCRQPLAASRTHSRSSSRLACDFSCWPVNATWKARIPSSPKSHSNRAMRPWPRINETSYFVIHWAAE